MNENGFQCYNNDKRQVMKTNIILILNVGNIQNYEKKPFSKIS